MLPDYLQYSPNAAASAQTVICGSCRFTVLTSRLLRIEQGGCTDDATLTVINRSFAAPEFTATENNGVLTLTTEALTLNYKVGQPLCAESLQIRLLTKPYTEWHFGDKALFNLGGTVSTLDCVNGACPINDGICAIDGFAVIDDSETALLLQNGWFAKRPAGLTDLYFFGYGHDYTACVQDYYRLTGIPEMLPAFALGNWWSRYHKYTDTEYLELMDKFKDADVPFSVGIVDMDWHITDGDGRNYYKEGWTGYTWNKALFPDYKAFLQGLHDRNLKTALNLHPAFGVQPWDDMYAQMAKEMGIDPATRQSVRFDCLNPKFLKAYFEILHFPYEKNGVDFWWMDWQQGSNYRWMHEELNLPVNELECITPLWMLNHMHYLASQRGGKRGLIFSRFAGFGSQRYPIGFSGDTIITWESLDFQPYFTATASNIGYGWWSHDIGGHMLGYRDDELNVRWVQFGVFSPIFRLHSTSDDFLGREPWNYGKSADKILRNYMRLRHKLFPYLYTMNYRNHTELLPLMRPMYHTHPEEKGAYTVKNQYWFGSELIAAPITKKADAATGMGRAEIWLPQGNWIDWFSGYIYKGGKTEVYRPLEQMPLFIKAGGIVPLQPHTPHDNALGNCPALELVIAAGGSNTFTLFEDDGETNAYKQGHYCTTAFCLDWQDTQAVFTIKPANGALSLIPAQRSYTLCFKGFRAGCTFADANGAVAAQYCAEENRYTVKISAVAAAEGVQLTIKNPAALLHDNRDYEQRANERIIQSQCPLHTKHIYADWVKQTAGGKPNHVIFACEPDNRVAGAIKELYQQI